MASGPESRPWSLVVIVRAEPLPPGDSGLCTAKKTMDLIIK